jgi:hypothetical protein
VGDRGGWGVRGIRVYAGGEASSEDRGTGPGEVGFRDEEKL